jgi:regulator of RNase E activity RraA
VRSRDHTPVAGKWHSNTTEVNGTIRLSDIEVTTDDLIVASQAGTCCMPRDLIYTVLERAEQIASEMGFDALLKPDGPVDGLTDYLCGRTD